MKIYSLVIFASLALIQNAFAFGEPPCASWTRADAVFSGTVMQVENAPKGEGFPDGAKKVRFKVLQNFKGVDNPTFAVVTKLALGADGAGKIKKGETWIVYASNDIVAKSFTEFRRAKIEPKTASDELETLKNIIAGKTSTAVTGQLVSQSSGTAYLFEPVEIAVEGGGRKFSGTTDPNGGFHIPVPDGNYRVELKFPYRASFKWDDALLGTSLTEGVPTLFNYRVRLNDGDCHFSFFEVAKN